MLPRHCFRYIILRSINNDLARNNSFHWNDNTNYHSQSCLPKFNNNFREYSTKIHTEKLYSNNKILFMNNFIRKSSTDTNVPKIAKDSEDLEILEFKSISPQDKKTISRHLGLKQSFLNETNIYISTNLNKLILNFYFSKNANDIQICPVHYNVLNYKDFINNDRLRKGVDSLNENPKPDFLFYCFEKNVPENFDFIHKNNDEELVIFDDIFDALAFYQQTKIPSLVIKLLNKNSNDSFKEFCIKLNNHYQKIYLWPNTNIFNNLRKQCLENFDIQKINFINSDFSASKMLQNDPKEKFVSVLENAVPYQSPLILNFNDLKDDVFMEFSDPTISGIQWSRFQKLNEHLKGHRSGELTIITGPTGCGKTTFVSEYSLDLCMQGVPTLWGSFEIKNIRLIKMMMTQFAKKSLSFSDKQIFDMESEDFSKLPLYFLKFHGQTEINLIMKAAKHAVNALGIKHIVIDNLQFMLGMNVESNYDRFLKQDFLISSLRQFSTEYDCHITLVAHPRKEKEEITLSNNSLYGGIKASQEADNVLIIMNKFNSRYRCNKYIQITKNRFNGSLGVVPLYFDKNTLCFSSSNPTTTTNNQQMDNGTNKPQTNIYDNDQEKDYVSDLYRIRYQLEN